MKYCNKENMVEFITGEDTITVSLTSRRHITKVKRLAEKFPDQVTIVAENEDGSIYAHLPIKCLKFGAPSKNMSEEKREAMRNRGGFGKKKKTEEEEEED